MGKVLVLYHSASGNTATMVRLVAEGAGVIPDTEVRLAKAKVAIIHVIGGADDVVLAEKNSDLL